MSPNFLRSRIQRAHKKWVVFLSTKSQKSEIVMKRECFLRNLKMHAHRIKPNQTFRPISKTITTKLDSCCKNSSGFAICDFKLLLELQGFVEIDAFAFAACHNSHFHNVPHITKWTQCAQGSSVLEQSPVLSKMLPEVCRGSAYLPILHTYKFYSSFFSPLFVR